MLLIVVMDLQVCTYVKLIKQNYKCVNIPLKEERKGGMEGKREGRERKKGERKKGGKERRKGGREGGWKERRKGRRKEGRKKRRKERSQEAETKNSCGILTVEL